MSYIGISVQIRSALQEGLSQSSPLKTLVFMAKQFSFQMKPNWERHSRRALIVVQPQEHPCLLCRTDQA